MNPSRLETLSIGVIVVMLIGSAVLLPYLAVSLLGPETTQTFGTLPGVPVVETIFSTIVSDQLDPVMFPGGIVEETETSIQMVSSYGDLSMVNESVAEDAAREMASHFSYLDGISFTFNHDWSRLDRAIWHLKMESPSVDVYLGVNALSATVTGFSPVWVGISPFRKDPSMVQVLNDSQVLEYGLAFLQLHNYTLSENARLWGPVLTYDTNENDKAFFIKFFHVVNGVVIWYSNSYGGELSASQIIIELDIETGQIISFRYLWTYVPEIPLQNVIGPDAAVQAALEYLRVVKEEPNVNATPFSLVFEFTQNAHRLRWIVYTDHSLYKTMHIDAKSAEITSVSTYVPATDMPTYTPQYMTPETFLTNVISLLLLSVLPATIAYITLRYRIKDGYLP